MTDQDAAILALLAAEKTALEKIEGCRQRAAVLQREAFARAEGIRRQAVLRSQRWLHAVQPQRIENIQKKYESAALLPKASALPSATDLPPTVAAWLEQIIGDCFDADVSGSTSARTD